MIQWDIFMKFDGGLPGLVNIQKANWKMAIEIVYFPMTNGDFP